MSTFDEFITSLRNEFGEQGAGKPFEVFCKWFLENDPEWSKTIDKVWFGMSFLNSGRKALANYKNLKNGRAIARFQMLIKLKMGLDWEVGLAIREQIKTA